jgi:hypothetical protein
MRYKVFNSKDNLQPFFTAPGRGVALWYASIFGTGWKRCRVIDSHNGETLLDWAVAEPLISKEK